MSTRSLTPTSAASTLALCATLSFFAADARADVYMEDFAFDPGGSAGNAFVTDGFLQLSTNTNGNNGAFHIPAIPDSSTGFVATFDFTIFDDSPNPPADGFSFSYGPIPPGSLSAQAEEGWPGIMPVISFEIDTWMNGDTEVGVNVAVNGVDLPGGFTNGNILEDDTTVEGVATISWFPGVGASFSTTGLVTNADFVLLPTNFQGDDSYTFAFAARTGGADQEVQIDNLVITTGAPDSDGDGLPDAWEIAHMLDPDDNGENPNNNGVPGNPDNGPMGDPDDDGLTNLEEFEARTDPRNPDSDGDTLLDGDEVHGTAGMRPPTNPLSPDTDSDGLDDALETNSGVFNGAMDPGTDPTNADTDGDGSPDRREILNGTNPLDPDDFPSSPTGSYVQDFNGFPNGAAGTILGDGSEINSTNGIASVQNDAFQLILEGTGNTRSSYRIPAIPGSSLGWTATFELTLIDEVGTGPPADGFSFNYGAIPPFNPGQGDPVAPDSHGQGEEGWGTVEHISFEVDTWEVGSDENGYNIAGNVGGVQQDFAFQNTDILMDGESITTVATLRWDPVNGASMSSEATGDIFTNVATPGFTGDDSYVFAFGGRTGGAHQSVLIDNLVISSGAGAPFVITAIDYDSDLRQVTIVWNATSGRTYAVDFSTTLADGEGIGEFAWEELTDNVEATGDTASYSDSDIPIGTSQRFYRVRDITGP